MGFMPVNEEKNVPIFKNIFYAVKLLLKADKQFLIWLVTAQCSYTIFLLFFQNVLFLKVLLSIIQGSGSFKEYVNALIVFLIIGIINELISAYGDYAAWVGQKRVFKSLNNMIFKKASEVDISCYEDPAFYDKYKRATEVLSSGYFVFFSYLFAQIIGSILSFIFIIGVVASINAYYLIFLLPILIVFVIEVIKSKTVYKRDLEMTKNNRVKAYTQRTVFLKDFSKDMRTSNIFSVLIKRFNQAIEDNIHILKTYGIKLFIFSMASSFCGEFIPIVGTYVFSGYQFVVTKSLDIAGFSVVLSSINSVHTATTQIAEAFGELSKMALYFQNLREFFDYEIKIHSGDKTPGDFENLTFRNVSFKYPDTNHYVLKNITLEINKGETIAIVGINGAGKTTFTKLLLRFYDIDEGEILYNGINIKEYDINKLRRRFATVFQDYKIFALSINENVICHECSEDDRIIAENALKRSGVHKKISTLPNGGDTVLTKEFDDEGAGLSGGEAQKTAVARMFAKKFDIAILDEPSSALDPIAEHKMYENLLDATKDKTVVYISHRLSCAVMSDNIFVFKEGQIIESGNHEELMKTKNEYSKMFALQASSYNNKEELK